MKSLPVLIMFILSLNLTPGVRAQNYRQEYLLRAADSLNEASEFSSAIEKYLEFIRLQKEEDIDNNTILKDSYINIAVCYYELDRYSDAIDWFRKALELQRKAGDLEGAASTLNNIGLNYKLMGLYDKAVEYYEQTIKIDEELGKGSDIAITLNNIALVYRSWGKYDKAIENIEKSLRLRQSLNDQKGISKALNNLGLVYTEWKKYDQAILYFHESMKIEDSLKNIPELAVRLNNIGRVYFYLNQYDTALYYFEKTLAIHQKNNDLDNIALAYNNLGKVYKAENELTSATHYYTLALQLFDSLGKVPEKATVMANLSDLYHEMGFNNKALNLLDSSTAIAFKNNQMTQLQQNYLYFSGIYADEKNFEKSLEYYKKYTVVKDTIFSRESLKQLTDFQTKYEKEKDQAIILALEKENLEKTNQRNTYLFIALGIIILTLFLALYFRQRAANIKLVASQKIRKLEEEQKLIAAKLLVEGQEMERKRIATELHDGLGVVLSATKMQFSVIKEKNPDNQELIDKASKMLEQATGDIRKISHNMMPGLLTRLGFYEAAGDLIEKINDTQSINAICTITGNDEERLPENNEIMLYRIVQELVNNTIKHARAANIHLNIMINPDSLNLVYTDDGKGFDVTEKIGSNSIGLKSIQSRVSFLNGKMDIQSSPGKGVKYTIHIAL